MSSCCAANGASATRSAAAVCAECGGKGRALDTITLKALLRPDALARLDAAAAYRFCPGPACPVVYFAGQAGSVYHQEDLEVRVGVKETRDPVPVCYCFGHTRGSIWEEIRETGRSTAVESITAHIHAGRCGCEVNNPSGACCLGEVNRVVKEGMARFADRVALPLAGGKR